MFTFRSYLKNKTSFGLLVLFLGVHSGNSFARTNPADQFESVLPKTNLNKKEAHQVREVMNYFTNIAPNTWNVKGLCKGWLGKTIEKKGTNSHSPNHDSARAQFVADTQKGWIKEILSENQLEKKNIKDIKKSWLKTLSDKDHKKLLDEMAEREPLIKLALILLHYAVKYKTTKQERSCAPHIIQAKEVTFNVYTKYLKHYFSDKVEKFDDLYGWISEGKNLSEIMPEIMKDAARKVIFDPKKDSILGKRTYEAANQLDREKYSDAELQESSQNKYSYRKSSSVNVEWMHEFKSAMLNPEIAEGVKKFLPHFENMLQYTIYYLTTNRKEDTVTDARYQKDQIILLQKDILSQTPYADMNYWNALLKVNSKALFDEMAKNSPLINQTLMILKYLLCYSKNSDTKINRCAVEARIEKDLLIKLGEAIAFSAIKSRKKGTMDLLPAKAWQNFIQTITLHRKDFHKDEHYALDSLCKIKFETLTNDKGNLRERIDAKSLDEIIQSMEKIPSLKILLTLLGSDAWVTRNDRKSREEACKEIFGITLEAFEKKFCTRKFKNNNTPRNNTFPKYVQDSAELVVSQHSKKRNNSLKKMAETEISFNDANFDKKAQEGHDLNKAQVIQEQEQEPGGQGMDKDTAELLDEIQSKLKEMQTELEKIDAYKKLLISNSDECSENQFFRGLSDFLKAIQKVIQGVDKQQSELSTQIQETNSAKIKLESNLKKSEENQEKLKEIDRNIKTITNLNGIPEDSITIITSLKQQLEEQKSKLNTQIQETNINIIESKSKLEAICNHP